MASNPPLTGSELIDCARANGSKGIAVAASRCGYDRDQTTFEAALRQAGEHLGIDIAGFEDLIHPPDDRSQKGVDVAPETNSTL